MRLVVGQGVRFALLGVASASVWLSSRPSGFSHCCSSSRPETR